MAKIDLPRSPINYSHEDDKWQELRKKYTSMTTGVNISFTSLSSGIVYTDTDGEYGLFVQLSAIPEIANSRISASEYNTLEENSAKNSKGIAQNSAAIDELLVNASIDTKIVPTSGKFYDFVGSSGALSQGSIDFGKTYAATITTGTNTIAMTSLLSAKDGTTPTLLSDCFAVGDEVTLQDSASRELLRVTGVDDGLATLTLNANIVGTFSSGANIYRSNVIEGITSFEFGAFSSEIITDKSTPVQVINQADITNAHARPQVLSNGWVVTATRQGTTQVNLQVDKQDGNGFIPLCYNSDFSSNFFSLSSYGTTVYLAKEWPAGNQSYIFPVDVLTQTNVNLTTKYLIDDGQTAWDGIDIICNENGDILYSASTKNSTYPNSFNIRYTISIDGGVTWATVQQVSNNNTTGQNKTKPSLVYMNNGQPNIIYEQDFGGYYGIITYYFNGASWMNRLVYNGGTTYIQEEPVIDKLSDGSLIAAWYGNDSVEANKQIRYSKSIDNGVTWSAMEKLTTGNIKTNPTITRNDNDDIFIVCQNGTILGSHLLTFTTSWSESLISTGFYNPSACNTIRNFEKPLTIFRDSPNSDVKFYGKWGGGSSIDITEVDVRMNITPLENVYDIGAYLNISNNINTVDAQVSIVDSAAQESYTDLIDTRYAVDANNDEVASFLNTTVTPASKCTLKYSLNRLLTTDDIQINSIIGGVL